MKPTRTSRSIVSGLTIAALAGAPFFLVGCDRDESKSKTTTSKTVDTPSGTKKVTETTESKTTTDKK